MGTLKRAIRFSSELIMAQCHCGSSLLTLSTSKPLLSITDCTPINGEAVRLPPYFCYYNCHISTH